VFSDLLGVNFVTELVLGDISVTAIGLAPLFCCATFPDNCRSIHQDSLSQQKFPSQANIYEDQFTAHTKAINRTFQYKRTQLTRK
jgi:hypothetical protein